MSLRFRDKRRKRAKRNIVKWGFFYICVNVSLFCDYIISIRFLVVKFFKLSFFFSCKEKDCYFKINPHDDVDCQCYQIDNIQQCELHRLTSFQEVNAPQCVVPLQYAEDSTQLGGYIYTSIEITGSAPNCSVLGLNPFMVNLLTFS